MSSHEEAIASAETAEAALDEQIYGLSVECFDVPSVDDALRACRRPNKMVRISTAARIRAAGLDVVPTLDEPHGTMVVPKPLDADAWNLLQRLFEGPIENPYRLRR